jgi:hypothetical protein
MTATNTDWVAPGAKAAHYFTRSYTPSVQLTTIERLTATQIITTGGHRYRRDTLQLVGDNYGGELLPVDAPQVRNAIARDELSSLRGTVERLCYDAGNDVESVLATLDEIAAAVAAAREAAAPTGKEN